MSQKNQQIKAQKPQNQTQKAGKKNDTGLVILFAVIFIAVCIFGVVKNGKLAEMLNHSAEVENATPSDMEGMTSDERIDALSTEMPEKLGELKKLADYKALTAEVAAEEPVTDEDVDSYIEYSVLPNYVEDDDTVKDGDTVTISYVGRDEKGNEFDGGTAEDQELVIGSDSYIPGFETGLIGHKKDDEVDLDLTFPADYSNADLAGKDVTFHVTIGDIKTTPVLDDELANEIDSGCKTVAEYKETIKKQLQEDADEDYESTKENAALQALLDQCEVETADDAIEAETNIILKNYKQNITSMFGSVDSYLQTASQSYDEFVSQAREQAEIYIKEMIILDAIAEREKISVTQADIKQFAEDNGTTEEMLSMNYDDAELHKLVSRSEAMKLITDNTTFTEPKETETTEAATVEAGAAEADETAEATPADETETAE